MDALRPKSTLKMTPYLALICLLAMGKAMKSRDLLSFSTRLFETHGRTFQYNSWSRTAIMTMQPGNIQVVLSISFWNFVVVPIKAKPSKNKKPGTGNALMPKVILTVDGAIWEHARSLIKPTFPDSRLPTSFSWKGIQCFNKLLDPIPRDGSTVDLVPLVKRFVFSPRPNEHT